MNDYFNALARFQAASNALVKHKDGIDKIYVHPAIFHEFLRIGQTTSIHIEFDRWRHGVKLIRFRGTEIYEGQGAPANPIMY